MAAGASTLPLRALPTEDAGPPWWRREIERSTVTTALVVIALNLIDAFSTLHHVAMGAEEVNPLMRLLLDRGPYAFLLGKHLLAAAGVLGIVAQGHHLVARRMLRFVLLPIYLAIATYQVALFAFL